MHTYPTVKVWKETQPGHKPKPVPPKVCSLTFWVKGLDGVDGASIFGHVLWLDASADQLSQLQLGDTPQNLGGKNSVFDFTRKSTVLFSFSFFLLLFQLMSCSWFYRNLQCFFSLLLSFFFFPQLMLLDHIPQNLGGKQCLWFYHKIYNAFSLFLLPFQLCC